MKKTNKKTTRRRRVLTDAERKARREEQLNRLKEWKEIHMKDPEYRAEKNRRRNEYQRKLEREAEFGRIAMRTIESLVEFIKNGKRK